VFICSVKSAYKEPLIKNIQLYKELIFIPKELVHYTFIRNSSYKEHIFMVLMIAF